MTDAEIVAKVRDYLESEPWDYYAVLDPIKPLFGMLTQEEETKLEYAARKQ